MIMRLWMPRWRHDSECQNEIRLWTPNKKWSTTLNAKLKMRWLWMSKWKSCSECQTEDELQLWTPNGKWTMTLNAKQKMNDGSERQNENVALNGKWKMNNGSEHQNENEQWLWTPKQKMWLGTPNGKTMTILNVDPNHGSECWTKIVAMNVELWKWLWTQNRR